MTLKTLLQSVNDNKYCSKSPIKISKKEIGSMTVEQLREILNNCGLKTSGDKDALVNRVYRNCKRQLEKQIQKSCKSRSGGKSRKSRRQSPVINLDVFDSSSSVDFVLDDRSRDEVISDLANIGINHAKKNMSADELKKVFYSPRCSEVNNFACPSGRLCDIRDNVCTTRGRATNENVVEATINGRKIFGSVDAMTTLANRINGTCNNKSNFVHLNGVNYSQCQGPNYLWKTNEGCFGRAPNFSSTLCKEDVTVTDSDIANLKKQLEELNAKLDKMTADLKAASATPAAPASFRFF